MVTLDHRDHSGSLHLENAAQLRRTLGFLSRNSCNLDPYRVCEVHTVDSILYTVTPCYFDRDGFEVFDALGGLPFSSRCPRALVESLA